MFKLLMLQSPILQRPDFKRPFRIVCDASNVGVGAVLEQIDDAGKPYTVAYWSKTLNSAERNYHTTERELLAVIEAIKHFKHYVGGSQFTVVTDHNALTHLNTSKALEGRLQRWALLLQEYSPTWEFRPGREQGSADGLSRLGHDRIAGIKTKEDEEMSDTIEPHVEIQEQIEKEHGPDNPYDDRILEYDTVDRWDVHELRKIDAKSSQVRNKYLKEQQEDIYLSSIINQLRKQDVTLNLDNNKNRITLRIQQEKQAIELKFRYDEFRIIDDLLYHIVYDKQKKINLFQLCIPQTRREEIKRSLHENYYGGMHLGLGKCWDKLRNRYWWPLAYTELRNWILSCPKCQRYKSRNTRAQLQPNLVTHEPFECVGVDILGPLPVTSPHKYRYIIVFIDHFTSWVEAVPLRDILARTCAEALILNVILRHGVPRQLLSDRGSQFMSTIAAEVNNLMGIKKLNTTAFHPQTNGKVEKFNNTLLDMISMYVGMKQKDWDQFLPYAIFAYNTSRHQLNQFSPYYLMHGREPNYPTDAMVRTDSDTFLSVGKWTRKIIRRIRRAHYLAERYQRVVYSGYLQKSLAKPPKPFLPGQLVLMKHMRPEQPGSQKLVANWHGPYIVTEQIAPVTYRIRIPSRTGSKSLSYITHVNRLKRYRERTSADDISEVESEQSREQILREALVESERRQVIRRSADEAESHKPKNY